MKLGILKPAIRFKLILFLVIMLLFSFCNVEQSIDNNILEINLSNCSELNFQSKNPSNNVLEELYIIGHGYGSPSTNTGGISNKIIKFFKNLESKHELSIALTGDFVFESSIDNLESVKIFLENNFSNYFISPGNHDLYPEPKNYYDVFRLDFYHKEFNSYLLIAANFSNPNWLPTNEQIDNINSLINNTSKGNVVILSHQIFWQKNVNFEFKPNSFALLKSELSENSLNWIDNEDKNLIVISGDYGAFGQKTECYHENNRLFIANGIGDHKNDTLIKLSDTNEKLLIEEIKIP